MPGSGEAASYGDLLTTSLLVLGGVCVAAFVVVKMLGRFLSTGSRRGAHLLDVIARVPLEPRRSLYVVDVAGKTLLVGTSEMGLSVLSELDRDAVQARVVDRRPTTFAELVRNAWLKRKASRSPDGADAHAGADEIAATPVVGSERTPPAGTSPPAGPEVTSPPALSAKDVGEKASASRTSERA